MTSQDIRSVFSALHDGCITAAVGNQQCLRLTIACQYLAELVEAGFTEFYLYLENITELTLKAWLVDDATELWTDWGKLAASEWEIATAEVDGDVVVVWCNQDFNSYGSYGGELRLRCAAVIIRDQQERLVTSDELRQLAAQYWRGWTQQSP